MKALSAIGASVVLCVLSSQGFAQTPPASPAHPPAATAAPAAPVAAHTMWRASKMIGVAVYNEQNERLGDINEVLLDSGGRVGGYVVGVGGFLGMGEHDILVTPDKLKFVNEAMKSDAATRPNNSNRPPRDAKETWYPDHAIMAGNKDSLKAIPEFKYNK